MNRHSPILMASSLRAESDRILGRALHLVGEMETRLVLLHVLEDRNGAEAERARLGVLLDRDLGELAGRFEIRFETGSAPATISRVAEETDASLVVAGAPRFNSAGDYILGTAVDYLVRRSPVPVLIVRRRAHAPYRRILAVTDFSTCSQVALEAADDFFGEARIDLLHSFQPSYGALLDREETGRHARAEAEREMADFLSELELGLRERITPSVEEGELDALVQRRFLAGEFDLLVLGTHGRGGFAHATIGSRASRLLSNSPSDVMMVRDTM